MCGVVQAQKWVSFLTTNFYEMTIGPTGYDEFMNSRNKSYKVPELDPKIMSYQDYMDLVYRGVYLDESYQIEPQTYTNLLRGIENHPDGCKITEQKPYHSWHNPGGKKEVVIQNREELEEEITQYLLNEYDEQEKVHYSWKEFFEVFALVVYSVAMLTLMYHVSIIWQLIVFGIILLSGIAYSKIKKHYKNQKEIDDLLCQYGVISMKDQPQHEEILYQQLVEKKVF